MLRSAIDQNTGASQRASIAAQTQLANLEASIAKAATPPSGGLSSFFAGIKNDAASAALGMVGFGAALQAVIAIGGSFVDAFNLKTSLDASTASINTQIGSVRDVGQVWSEAGAFANQYKLTQAQTVAAVGASINVLKTSAASVGDTLEALSRLNLANTEESIQGAAFALAELASGDINSIVERFRVSKTEAYAMRDAIQAGADPVLVLTQYLDQAGLSAEALKTQTLGAAGAMKDAAVAAEDLKLAQAEWAQGPGLQFLEAQVEVTTGLTRLLGGGGGLAEAYRNVTAEAAGHLAGQLAYGKAMSEGATAAEAQIAALTAQRDAIGQVLFAQEGGTSGGKEWGAAQDAATAAAQANTDATVDLITKTLEEADAKQQSADKAQQLAQFQRDLANIGGAVAAGHITAANGAAQLIALYGGASDAAERLIGLQAQIAGGAARIAAQGAQTRNLVPDGLGFNAPGRKGQSDAGILATIARTQAEAEAKALQDARDKANPKGGGGGGRAGVAKTEGAKALKVEQDLANKSEDLEREHQDRLTEIVENAAAKRREAEAAFNQDALDGRADFYSSLIDMEDQGLARTLAARYEAIQAQAAEIARTQGADAAQDFEDTAVKGLERAGKREQQIKEAEAKGDTDKAEAQRGIAELERKADEARLASIRAQGSEIAAEEARRIAEEDRRLAQAQGKLETTTARKLGTDVLPTGEPPVDKSEPQAVIDVATPAAVDQLNGDVTGQLASVRAAVEALGAKLDGIKSEVAGLKSSRAFAGGG